MDFHAIGTSALLWKGSYFGPAILPKHGGDLQEGAAGGAVVSMENQVVAARLLQNCLMAGTLPIGSRGSDHQAAAALGHRLPVLIDVRTRDFAGAPHYHVVRAVHSAATAVEGRKEIEI